MNNHLKARIILELLDELKYPVLASFSTQELGRLNSVSLDDMESLTKAEITSTINDFLTHVEESKEMGIVEPEPDESIVEPIAGIKSSSIPTKQAHEPKKELKLAEKIQMQPAQLLACVLDRVNNDQRLFILSQLSAEKKQLIDAIKVEKTPISNQVVQLILKELDLTAQ